jgi:dienelactone hydrolase
MAMFNKLVNYKINVGISIAALLAIILLAASIVCACNSGQSTQSKPHTPQEPEVVKEQVRSGFLGQDFTLLENSNGKIVSLKTVQVDSVEIYKIKYLSDGLEIVGFILKPEGDEGKYPILIYNRGYDPEADIIEQADLQKLATYVYRGFVVLASQYRGNGGSEGRDEFGGDDVNDVLNFIPLAESLPFTSSDKIVMLGVSRGGMMTYIALSKSNKIRAAVIYSGVADCIQTYNESEESMKQVFIDCIGGDPVQKEAAYKSRSANYWPEKINAPVLILHGDADRQVSVQQAQELAAKLKALGKNHELVIYPDGDHSLSKYYVDSYTRTLNWFTKHLPDFRVKTPWLGIRGMSIDQEMSSTLKLPVETGIYVVEVTEDSPAEKAGIKPSGYNDQGQIAIDGDIIIAIDGTSLKGMHDLLSNLTDKKVGDEVSLLIYRGTEKINVSVQLEELPIQPSSPH